MIYTLHGWSFDRRVWTGTPFEDGNHLELPGHGESPFKSTDLLDLAEEVVEKIKGRATLVGWSLGATVSLIAGALHPEKVEKLILLAPTLKFSGVSQPEVVVERFLKKLRRDFWKAVKEFRALCTGEEFPIPKLQPEVATQLLESFSRFDLSPYAEQVKLPVEILVGEEDSITGVVGALSVFKGLKNARLTVYPKEDHFTLLYSPSA